MTMHKSLSSILVALITAPSLYIALNAAQEPASTNAGRTDVALGFFEPPANTVLTRLNPVTFEALEPRVPLGEYRWTAAVSPDGSRLAVSTGGPRGGIHIFSLPQLQRLHRVHAGIAAEALAWLSPTRLAAALLCNPMNSAGRGCAVTVVDADIGRIVRRWPDTEKDVQSLPFTPPLGSLPKPVAVTRHGVLFLLAHVSALAPARLVLVTHGEEFRSASLSRIELGGTYFNHTSGALATDAHDDRAFVVGVERTLAEIELDTMDVRYREIEALKASPGGGRRAFVRLDGGRLAVFGEGLGTDAEPAGVTVIDTETWRSWTVDPEASRAAFAADTLLVYGGRSVGLTGYSSDGRRRFRLFDEAARQSVASVHTFGSQAYVVTNAASPAKSLTIIDAITGMVVREMRPSEQLIDLLATSAR